MCVRKLVVASLLSFTVIPMKSQPTSTQTANESLPSKRTHARASVSVKSSEAKLYDGSANPVLKDIIINETFSGDIEGESLVHALQIFNEDHSASMVSLQRFRGKVGDKQGTFILQGSEKISNGKIEATWFVVPGSATDQLTGLHGEGGFSGEFGKGSTGFLDYWFE